MATLAELEQRVARVEAAQKRVENTEERAERDATIQDTKVGRFTFGKAANRPAATKMRNDGVGSMLYFAWDTYVLSAWTGSEWKETTLT